MARFVKVASVAMNIPEYRDKPEGQSLSDYMLEMIKVEIDRVLPDKPDLIVLPEMADTPAGMTLEEKREFWKTRGNRTEEDLGKIAKENNCYIAAGVVRIAENGKQYNSCVMIDRQGKVMGYYDKNYIVPSETPAYGNVSGEDITVFECDFGIIK